MEPQQRQFSIWYVLIASVALVLLQSMLAAPHRETPSYSEFKALLRYGKVTEAIVDPRTVSATFTRRGSRATCRRCASRR